MQCLLAGCRLQHCKELNFLIFQVCNYYEIGDKNIWTSPILEALRVNWAVSITTPGRTIAPAKAGEVSNFTAIDTMVEFGTRRITNMEDAWTAAVAMDFDTTTGDHDLKNTMMMLRQDVKFKKARL